MKKSQRWTAKWFTLALWLIAFLFAYFLIELVGRIVGDLPRVEATQTESDFINQTAFDVIVEKQKQADLVIQSVRANAALAHDNASRADLVYKSAKEEFSNWIETRRTTERQDQDDAVIAQTKSLNELQRQQLEADKVDQKAQGQLSNAEVRYDRISSQNVDEENNIKNDAYTKLNTAVQWQEFKVFLYRLALTLPLLIIAGWLCVKKRKSTYWPFVWGFIFFSLFAFFVELVPYMPSYGGYVRAAGGIILSVFIGVGAIRGLKRYNERQEKIEQ